MSPSFAVRERDFPAFTLSHMTLPPLDARLTLSENDRERTVMLSFVVLAEREESRLSGSPILIFRYSADGFVPIKSVHSLL